MNTSIRKRAKRAIYRHFLKYAYRDLFEAENGRRTIASIRRFVSEFDSVERYAEYAVPCESVETGYIRGEVAHAIRTSARPTHRMLLAGDLNTAKPIYARVAGLPQEQVFTAGVHREMDFFWNYEAMPRGIPMMDLIVSQAMLEHLLNPFQHVSDCYSLLRPGGSMVFHTVMPGFKYHRYPIDCHRFFPDWFEAVAARLGAQVAHRYIGVDCHLCYRLVRPMSAGL